MANCMFGFRNLADTATIVTSPATVAGLPAANLQDPRLSRLCRVASTNGYLQLDLGASQAVRVVALFGTSLTAIATRRVRIGDDASFATAAHDSGTALAGVDPAYCALAYVVPNAPATGRHVRVDFADTSLAQVDFGRAFIGPVFQPGINFAYGWSSGRQDLSRRSRVRGGQVYVDALPTYRVVEIELAELTAAEAQGELADLDRLIGLSGDVLLITDPASANLGRDSVWGMVTALNPFVQPDFGTVSRRYQIEERL